MSDVDFSGVTYAPVHLVTLALSDSHNADIDHSPELVC